ncbi:hypothetical protein ABIF65_010523 [Bradyrhizobium japonicum]
MKICSLYGAGFYYIPGTDTCIKLGGYLRAETSLSASVFNGNYSGVQGAQNRLTNYYFTKAREDFNIDTRTATEYGVVRTFFDATFSWTTDAYSGSGTTAGATVYSQLGSTGVGAPSNANAGAVAGGTLGVYYAFIQFAGFTIGKAVSQFDAPWTNYPGNNFDGLVGGGGTVTGVNQLTYTADFGEGITASISAVDPTAYYQSNLYNVGAGLTSVAGFGSGNFGANDFGGTRAPDIQGMFRVDQAWGLFQASVAAHNNHAAYYGATEPTGHPGDKWGWAAQLGCRSRIFRPAPVTPSTCKRSTPMVLPATTSRAWLRKTLLCLAVPAFRVPTRALGLQPLLTVCLGPELAFPRSRLGASGALIPTTGIRTGTVRSTARTLS